MTSRFKLKSTIWHGDQCFIVSTIERDSSAKAQPPAMRFNETLAWEYDEETEERGNIVASASGRRAFDQHVRVCRELFTHGEFLSGGEG